jgi:hypothetical protein
MSIRSSLVATVFVSSLATAAEPSSYEGLIDANRFEVRVEDGRLLGPGGERLAHDATAADIVMFGENHGAKEIAELAAALFRSSSETSPRRLVTEIGPATAAEMEAMLHSGAFREFLSEGMHLQSVPFFSLDDEIPLVEAAAREDASAGPAIWGVDQEFIAGAPIVLPRLERLAATRDEHRAVAAIERNSVWNPLVFGMGDSSALDAAQVVFARSQNAEARALTEQLVLGRKIYKEQSDDGDAKWSNERREALLMDNFVHYAALFDDRPGPLFLKLGAYHLMRGASPLVSEAFGQRVERWATLHGLSTMNVFVDCAGGKLRDGVLGFETDCDQYLSGDADLFNRHVIDNRPTLFDLRPLRVLFATGAFPKKLQRVVANYDYYLIVPGTHASPFASGFLVTRVYGGTIAGAASIILVALLFWIYRFVVRRMHRRRAKATPASA